VRQVGHLPELYEEKLLKNIKNVFLLSNYCIFFFTFLALSSQNFIQNYLHLCGQGSSVGIATGYGLDGPEIESQ
jgi:hypothetical protein